MMLPPSVFEIMEESLERETKDMPDDVGISISLWKLKALMSGYRFALNIGMGPHNDGT